MANVSLAVPTIHPLMGIDAGGAVNHQPEFAAACVTESADKALHDGAVAMAWTAIDAAARARCGSGCSRVRAELRNSVAEPDSGRGQLARAAEMSGACARSRTVSTRCWVSPKMSLLAGAVRDTPPQVPTPDLDVRLNLFHERPELVASS